MNIKLLKELDFAGKINSCSPVTEAGKEIVNTYRGWIFQNPATCGLVNGFVQEAKNFQFDAGLASTLEDIQKFIKKNNISWQLASACESISSSNSSYNYIARLGVDKVQKLLNMDESDVVSYIKAGSLKSVQYIPEFRNICKQVYKSTVNETFKANYSIVNPVSYVLVSENTQYFNVNGSNFKIFEGKVEPVNYVDDNTYNYVNQLLESFAKKGDDIIYEYKNQRGETVSFIMNDNGLEFKKGLGIDKKFTSPVSFLEYCNTLSKAMPIKEKMDFMNKVSAINTVFENYENIVILDCAKLINTSNGFSGVIVEAKDNVNLTVFHSVNAGSSSNNFEYVVEAVNNVTRLTGIDLSAEYAERINEDCKKDNTDKKEITEQLKANKQAQFDIRKKKIAQLAESYKNDPVKIAMLNNIARDLNILEKD